MTLFSLPSAATPARRSRFGRLLAVVFALSALAVWSASPASADTQSFAANFDSGNLDSWSDTSGVTLGSWYAYYGDTGAKVVTTPDAGGYLEWAPADVPNGMQYARIRGWVRLDYATPGEPVGLMTVKNTNGEHHFDIFVDADGNFRWDLFSGDHAESTVPAVVHQWYYIEALVDFGGTAGTTYTAQVRIDGVDQPSITSVDQVGANVKSAWFGGPMTASMNVREYDGLALDVGDAPFTFSR